MENSFRNISKVEDIFKARIIILTFLWADFNEESFCKELLIEQIIDEKYRKALISDEFAECFLERINYIVEKIVSNNFEFVEKINEIINILKQNEENKNLFEEDNFALNFLGKVTEIININKKYEMIFDPLSIFLTKKLLRIDKPEVFANFKHLSDSLTGFLKSVDNRMKVATNNRLYEINYAIYKSIISITNNYYTRLRLNYIFRFDKIVEQEKGFYNINKESIDIIVDDILKTEIDRLNNLAQRNNNYQLIIDIIRSKFVARFSNKFPGELSKFIENELNMLNSKCYGANMALTYPYSSRTLSSSNLIKVFLWQFYSNIYAGFAAFENANHWVKELSKKIFEMADDIQDYYLIIL
uniref:Uncharacterized protein n=1 Tax=Meloidogyne javanica TaxID=6303 RepID=A0A915MDN3_MELJA